MRGKVFDECELLVGVCWLTEDEVVARGRFNTLLVPVMMMMMIANIKLKGKLSFIFTLLSSS